MKLQRPPAAEKKQFVRTNIIGDAKIEIGRIVLKTTHFQFRKDLF